MKEIWAPWRKKYILTKQPKTCLFCKALKENKDRTNFVVERTKFSFSMLNIFPYNSGHLMVAPYRHTKDLKGLSDEELLDLLKLVRYSQSLLDKVLRPQGYNIGINLGKVAGAGITGHLHIHIVPRWAGDTNFMPVISDAKVIPESLDSLCKRLKR